MLCKKKSHVPLRCEEVVTDEQNTIAHAVEEEMTLALLRECPNCKCKLIKDQGCNKIICSRCRHAMCYQCNQEISAEKIGYDHFCKTPHCQHESCGKCVLWDRAGAAGDDAKKVKEAGERATKEVREKLMKEGKSEKEADQMCNAIQKRHINSIDTDDKEGASNKPVANGAVWNVNPQRQAPGAMRQQLQAQMAAVRAALVAQGGLVQRYVIQRYGGGGGGSRTGCSQ
mgnify:FL=1